MAKSGKVQKSLRPKKEEDAVQSKKKTGKVREELGDNKSEGSDSWSVNEQVQSTEVSDDPKQD